MNPFLLGLGGDEGVAIVPEPEGLEEGLSAKYSNGFNNEQPHPGRYA